MRMALKMLLVLIGLVGLAQLLLWYGASRWFDGLSAQLAPTMSMQYRSSYAWLNGRAGVVDARARPVGALNDQLTAQRIEIDAGGPLALAQLFWGGHDRLPERLDTKVQRFRLDPALERQLRDRSARLGFLLPFEALGCGDRGRFGGADYAELGWLQTDAELSVSLRSDALARSHTLLLVHDQQPQARIELEFDAMELGSLRELTGAADADWRLGRLRVALDDRSMLGQRNAYCSRRRGVPETDFLDLHMQAVAEELEARGLFVDAPVHRLYREYARHGGRLELRANPEPGWQQSGPDQRLRRLNLTLSHDGGPQVPVSARFFTAGAGADSSSATGAAADTVRVQVRGDDADLVEFEELDDLIGRRLLIRTIENRGHAGVLLGTRGELVRIEVERAGRRQVSAIAREVIVEMRLSD